MQSFPSSRRWIFTAALFAFAPGLASSQTLPPALPTVTPPPTAAPSIDAEVPSRQSARRARVDFNNGQLTVTADNSSLNQILRDISRSSGLKITGGVVDERVFGIYGPSDTATVLATLLRGTGSNMLIVFDRGQAPRELILTPRQGGPTPPNPNAARDDDQVDLPPQRTQHFPRPDGAFAQGQNTGQNGSQNGSQNGNQIPPLPIQQQVPPAQQPQFSPLPTVGQPPPDLQPPPPNTTTQESPNGVKTPQQIYDQLLKMQQQQKKSAPGAGTPP